MMIRLTFPEVAQSWTVHRIQCHWNLRKFLKSPAGKGLWRMRNIWGGRDLSLRGWGGFHQRKELAKGTYVQGYPKHAWRQVGYEERDSVKKNQYFRGHLIVNMPLEMGLHERNTTRLWKENWTQKSWISSYASLFPDVLSRVDDLASLSPLHFL